MCSSIVTEFYCWSYCCHRRKEEKMVKKKKKKKNFFFLEIICFWFVCVYVRYIINSNYICILTLKNIRTICILGFPGGSNGKESTCQWRRHDTGLISGSRRSPGGGYDNPLQYSCLENARTEKPGGWPSMASRRVGYNWSDLACTHMHAIRNVINTRKNLKSLIISPGRENFG